MNYRGLEEELKIIHSKPRHHKATNSYGIADVIKELNIPLSNNSLFRLVIRLTNLLICKYLSEGKDIELPYKMGTICVRKYKGKIRYKNNKLIIPYPIDWLSTWKLWSEDSEAKANKTLIRFTNDYTFRIKYDTTKAYYHNKGFYTFRANRLLKRALKDKVNKGLDAFLLWKNNT